MDLENLTRPVFLIEELTIIKNDFPSKGESYISSNKTRYGPFPSKQEYEEKKRELTSQREKEGWTLSQKQDIFLEMPGGEIRYFLE